MGFNYTADESFQMGMNSRERKLNEIERRFAVVEKKLASDSRENMHGEWRRDFSGNEFYWYCTNCKEEYYEDDLYMGGNEFPNFCPNCGADMRKGENDD